ncbi:MAG: hypothetical protein R3B70_34820 [Polyangiaceae bacterium]
MSKEVAVFVCSHVFEGARPILLVSRADGDWQMLCGGAHEETAVPQVVGLNHLLDRDPDLRALLDLPPEWEAERAGGGTRWERRPIE